MERPEREAIKNLSAHNLPTHFSFRRAYLLGAKTQRDMLTGRIRAIKWTAIAAIIVAVIALLWAAGLQVFG